MRSLLMIGAVLLSQGKERCDNPHTYERPISIEEAASFTKNLVYVKDDRAGLCFAVKKFTTYAGIEIQSFTEVPCDKVIFDDKKACDNP